MKRFPAYIAAFAAIALLVSVGCRKDPGTGAGQGNPKHSGDTPYALYYLADERGGNRSEIIRIGITDTGEPAGRTELFGSTKRALFRDVRDLDVSPDGSQLLFGAERDLQTGLFVLEPETGSVTRLYSGLAFDPSFADGNPPAAALIEEGPQDRLLLAVSGSAEPRQLHLAEAPGSTLASVSFGAGNAAFLTMIPGNEPASDPRGRPRLQYLGSGMSDPVNVKLGEGDFWGFALSANGSSLAWIESMETGNRLSWAKTGPDGLDEPTVLDLDLNLFLSSLTLSPDGSSAWFFHHQAKPLSPVEPMEGELIRVNLSDDPAHERIYSFENGHGLLFGDISVTADQKYICMAMVPHGEAFLEDLFGPQPWDILVLETATHEIRTVERSELAGARTPGCALRGPLGTGR